MAHTDGGKYAPGTVRLKEQEVKVEVAERKEMSWGTIGYCITPSSQRNEIIPRPGGSASSSNGL